ncbi:MAG: sigma-54-dependent Fis family transcriptional regulator [Acidobacteria bacterium]|nr:sigma-54-dependent Fis family transcriptional regulator [Acidobacteriota bacterium]
MKGSILLVEDRMALRDAYRTFLTQQGYAVTAVGSAEDAEQQLSEREFAVLLLDYLLPGMNGLAFLEQIRSKDNQIAVILMTAFGEVKLAVKAMKLGAFDFLEKPIDLEHLAMTVERAMNLRQLERSQQISERSDTSDRQIVGRSPVIQELLQLVDRVAASQATCLLLGESGTGKELVARRLHEKSHRHDGPFLAVNCSALPRDLLESEMFGYERGAFTGAQGRKQGLIELADGGTLFLDEIGDMPLELQPKILRFIQESEFRRVGGQKIIKADVRLVCATNRNLSLAVREGHFREDLFYRVSVFPIQLPPLRQRPEDIPDLAQHFLKRAGHPQPELSRAVLDLMTQYAWPGNVRELENVIERAMILSPQLPLAPKHFPTNMVTDHVMADFELDLGQTIKVNLSRLSREAERQLIRLVTREETNMKRAAARLGISVKTLYNRIKGFGDD